MSETATQTFAPEDVQNTKGLACLSYLGFLFLIPMLANKESAYTRFHVNQGIVLFIADIVLYVVGAILSFILAFMGLVGVLLGSLVYLAISVFILVLVIMGIVNAVQGKAKELPLIGKIRILK